MCLSPPLSLPFPYYRPSHLPSRPLTPPAVFYLLSLPSPSLLILPSISPSPSFSPLRYKLLRILHLASHSQISRHVTDTTA
ncbi:hypothetical protein E2C01_075864 [Portunus trituberculatus]|uniref:Uncharacterized protein n=1 Tax=Portunus trituberculatus TaxID=210409 RepID=A0A5B7II71_PORTR|nr:hypothetical protein [Portunus trituberculatus]